MSVILTGMDMPKNCGECGLSYEDNYFSKDIPVMCPRVYSPLGLNVIEKPENCPLKSADGLIEKIESINPTDYGSISSYGTHNAVKDVKRDIIEIIKEYCGMEEKS